VTFFLVPLQKIKILFSLRLQNDSLSHEKVANQRTNSALRTCFTLAILVFRLVLNMPKMCVRQAAFKGLVLISELTVSVAAAAASAGAATALAACVTAQTELLTHQRTHHQVGCRYIHPHQLIAGNDPSALL
jgi:hypothetical protein